MVFVNVPEGIQDGPFKRDRVGFKPRLLIGLRVELENLHLSLVFNFIHVIASTLYFEASPPGLCLNQLSLNWDGHDNRLNGPNS